MPLKSVLLALLLAPLLLAPVRLKDSTPAFFTPPGIGPAPESYSLPPAEALISPTVIMVSPTVLTAPSPTFPTLSGTISLPLPPATVTPQQIIVIQQPVPNLMAPMAAALCIKSLELVQNIAVLSYQQKRNQRAMTLALAAAAASGEAGNRQWPNLAAFNKADASLPWFMPQKAEVRDATAAAKRLCAQ